MREIFNFLNFGKRKKKTFYFGNLKRTFLKPLPYKSKVVMTRFCWIYTWYVRKYSKKTTNNDSNIFAVFKLFFLGYEIIRGEFANIWYSWKLYVLFLWKSLLMNPSIFQSLFIVIPLFTYSPFHKTLPKSSQQMYWISVRFSELGDSS